MMCKHEHKHDQYTSTQAYIHHTHKLMSTPESGSTCMYGMVLYDIRV